MPRKYAQVKLGIWSDEDWLELNPADQHLYLVALTSPELSLAGVTDWRPRRIAKRSRGWTPDMIEKAAASLIDRLYFVVDDDTEEVLIRSFVRHDGIVDSPNMMTAMARAYGAIASSGLRRVLVHELQRLYAENPEAKGWASTEARELLGKPSTDPSTYPCGNPSRKGSTTPSGNPSGNGSRTPSVNPSGTRSGKGSAKPSPTPAPAPSTSHQAPFDSLRESGDADATPRPDGSTVTPQTVTAVWVDACKANDVNPSEGQKGNVGKLAKELLRSNDPARVLAAAEQAGARGQTAIDRELTVMNGRVVAQPQQRRSTTDDRVAQALAAAAEFATPHRTAIGGTP